MRNMELTQIISSLQDPAKEPEMRKAFGVAMGVTVGFEMDYDGSHRHTYRVRRNEIFFGFPCATPKLAWQSFTVTDAILREALDAIPLTVSWDYDLDMDGEPELVLRDMGASAFFERISYTKRSEVDRLATIALTIYLNQKTNGRHTYNRTAQRDT